MNKGRGSFFSARMKEILTMGGLALLLLSVAIAVFRGGDKSTEATAGQMSALEEKVSRILEEIDGVGEASVVVCEDEDEVTGVVVVCEGANDLRVVMDIREAVAAALNTEQKSVKIYLKKD